MNHYSSLPDNTTRSYTNNRNSASTYDAEGNELSEANFAVYQYDAAGRMVSSRQPDPEILGHLLEPVVRYLDGAGQETKRVNQNDTSSNGTNFFIRSSVLNKIVSEADSSGEKVKTFVLSDGTTLALQSVSIWGTENVTFFIRILPAPMPQETKTDRTLVSSTENPRKAEYASLGRNIADFR
jgi:hypothetical protein